MHQNNIISYTSTTCAQTTKPTVTSTVVEVGRCFQTADAV